MAPPLTACTAAQVESIREILAETEPVLKVVSAVA
jgi:hypothetical protein